MSESLRVRYGRQGRTPKNTLVTFRDDKYVYFGVSRCNFEAGDVFTKSRGKQIATRRAALAAHEADSYDVLKGTNLQVHESGLRGRVHIENVKELLSVFREIDTVLYERAVNSRTSHTKHVEVG